MPRLTLRLGHKRCSLLETEDFRRAYRAFAAKQKPQFEGN